MKPKLSDPRQSQEYFDKKLSFSTGPVELGKWIKDKEDIVIVDVRAKEDYEKGHIPGAISLPMGSWATPEGLAKDKINVVYCYTQTCHLAASAALEFSAQGYCCVELEGGFEGWKNGGLQIEGAGARKHPAAAHAK